MSSDTPTPAAQVDLLAATVETFAPVVGQTFEAIFTDGRLPLTLAEVILLGKPREAGLRAPFSLQFRGRAGLRLSQRIYRLENPAVGAMEIFLVQIGDGADGSKFEAIFN